MTGKRPEKLKPTAANATVGFCSPQNGDHNIGICFRGKRFFIFFPKGGGGSDMKQPDVRNEKTRTDNEETAEAILGGPLSRTARLHWRRRAKGCVLCKGILGFDSGGRSSANGGADSRGA
jgi:hypothetical protein